MQHTKWICVNVAECISFFPDLEAFPKQQAASAKEFKKKKESEATEYLMGLDLSVDSLQQL